MKLGLGAVAADDAEQEGHEQPHLHLARRVRPAEQIVTEGEQGEERAKRQTSIGTR